MTTKPAPAAVLREAIEKLKAGQTIEQVLGQIAYEHGRASRIEVAVEFRKLIIKGANRGTS